MKHILKVLLVAMTAFVLAACSSGGGGETSEVGDDTYVPDFKAGNLSFTDFWVPDTMETNELLAGSEVDIWFDVEAEEPKYNVYIQVDLIRLPEGNASDVTIDPATYTPDFELTGFAIDSSVVEPRNTEDPQPIILQKGQKYHVEKTFTMPDGIPDGTYAVVFTINQEDYFPEDDNLQGEIAGSESENIVVAGATIVGTPDFPNLRILSTELENSSFEFDGLNLVADPKPFYLSKEPVLNLNLEVESMAQDTVEPVYIDFELKLGETTYPLWFEMEEDPADGEDLARPGFAQTWAYDQRECKDFPVTASTEDERALSSEEKEEMPTNVEEVETEERCAYLFRQSQVGHTYKLHLTEDAATALEARTEDTPCELIITMTSAQEEYGEYPKSDNTKTLDVIYLPPTQEQDAAVQSLAYSSMSSTWESILDTRKNGGFGNSWFGANYTVDPELKWLKRASDSAPMRAYNDLGFTARGKLFGRTNEILNVWQETDMNLDNIGGSYFDYGAEVFGTRIWGSRTYMDALTTTQVKPRTLWSAGARFSKSQTFFRSSYWYFPYGIPVNVTARAYGVVGLRGEIFIGELNTLGLRGGPYVNANGQLEGSISVGFARAGVGGWVRLIDIYPESKATLQLQPSIPLATAKFEEVLHVNSMRGRLYLFGDRLKYKGWGRWGWKRRSYTLLNWGGWSWRYYPFNPIVKSFSTREFDVEYYDTTSLDKLGDSPYATGKETAIDHSWYHSGPSKLGGQRYHFSARWTGMFNFNDGIYTFVALTDDGFRLYVDGVLKLDEWHGQAATQYEVDVPMSEGDHEIKVEYYQGGGGAVAKLLWYKN